MEKGKERSGRTSDVRLSKALSWLLRHGANSQDLKLDQDGYTDVQSVLQLKQFRRYSLVDIQRVVETNDKRRFSLREKDHKLQIRANQGHTLPVSDEGLLRELRLDDVPDNVVHGTYFRSWEKIKSEGLSRMKRNHIHLSPGFPGEPEVISGIRGNCQIHIVVDVKKAMEEGLKFYESENKVILTPGNEAGFLPASYFKEVWDVKSKKIIYKNE